MTDEIREEIKASFFVLPGHSDNSCYLSPDLKYEYTISRGVMYCVTPGCRGTFKGRRHNHEPLSVATLVSYTCALKIRFLVAVRGQSRPCDHLDAIHKKIAPWMRRVAGGCPINAQWSKRHSGYVALGATYSRSVGSWQKDQGRTLGRAYRRLPLWSEDNAEEYTRILEDDWAVWVCARLSQCSS